MLTRAEDDAARVADFLKLADYLEALASPQRLRLLHDLRWPRAVGDVHLAPEEPGELRPDRSITRQAVRKHLARLIEAGLVTTQRGQRGTAAVEEYVVNHQMLFAIFEELRQVTRLTPSVLPAPAATMTSHQDDAPKPAAGARFIVVHGATEGVVFPIEERARQGPRGWVIGRRRGLAVSLDYDPFVSQEHAEVVREGERLAISDLSANKNGTTLNWEPLPRGGSRVLAHGDVVGVGRTLLLFRDQ